MTTCLPAASAASTNFKAGWVPPMVSMMTSTSGSAITHAASVVSRTPSRRTSRGLSRLRTAAQVRRTLLACAAGDAVGVFRQQSRTPVPTVPRPIMPMVIWSIHPFLPLDRPRRHADDGLPGGDVAVVRDDRVGPHDGVLADTHRRDQDRTGSDLAPVADSRFALLVAIEVGRDRGGARIDPLTDLGIPQVSQMPYRRAASQARLLGLDECAHQHPSSRTVPLAQVRKRSHVASRSDLDRPGDHRERVDDRVTADRRPAVDIRVARVTIETPSVIQWSWIRDCMTAPAWARCWRVLTPKTSSAPAVR